MNRDKQEPHTHIHTHIHAASVTHPHTSTPSHCTASSHTHVHTHSQVCAEPERCLVRETHTFPLSPSHGRTLCSWTQQNQTGLLSPTSGDSRMSGGNTASTVRHGYLPAHPLPLHPISSPSLPVCLSPSIHSSPVLPTARRHAWLKDTALRSAVVKRAAES